VLAVKSLFGLPQYQHARRISVYLSMPGGEISTAAIVNDALKSGKQVFIPLYYKRQTARDGEPSSIMDMLELQSLQDYETLQPDKWGIPTPSEEYVSQTKNAFGGLGKSEGEISGHGAGGLELIILPGMAFDQKLGRLGHGMGFYDHFLTRMSRFADERSKEMPYLGQSSNFDTLARSAHADPVYLQSDSRFKSKCSPPEKPCRWMQRIGG
jgi:5-formyltetrahydrofolate cyclo-ligase